MKINKTWQESLTVATVYTLSFYLILKLAIDALLTKYPSAYEDDVRIDIGITATLIAHIVALFCSYVAIVTINKLSHKSFSLKRFILFSVLIPLVYLLTQLGLGVLAMISSSYNYSSYLVYQISLVVCTWITIWIVYWLVFKHSLAQNI